MSDAQLVPGSIQDRLQHGTFQQPVDFSVKLWRYMDLPKFISLLNTRQLVLSRLDKFTDQHEGSLTAKTEEWIERFLREHKAKDGWDVISKHFRDSQRTTFVCCWHANEHESEAMWGLYCGQSGGVAVQTTYQLLVDSIVDQPDVYIGKVKYIDYEREWFPEANTYAPVMHKRIAFAHEREVRLVSSPSHLRSQEPDSVPSVITVPWNCEAFVQRVHVSPYAPSYFYEATQAIIRHLAPELNERLVWSYMKTLPIL